MRIFSMTGFALVTVAFLGGCGAYWNGSPEEETTVAKMKSTQSAKVAAPAPAAPAADPSITETTSAAAPAAAAAPVMAPAAKPKAMTDAEILGFLKTANSDEVAMAALAKKQGAKDVKGFAGTLATSHTDGNKKELDVEQKSSVKADDSAADTASLKSDADGTIAKLKEAKGKDFDKAFIDTQVAVHQQMLDAIDGKLAPAAQDDNVKNYVAAMRKNVADHLTKAQDLQKKLSAAPASKKAKGAAAKPASN